MSILCRKTVPTSCYSVLPGRVEGKGEDLKKQKTKKPLYFRRAQKEPSTLTAPVNMESVCTSVGRTLAWYPPGPGFIPSPK